MKASTQTDGLRKDQTFLVYTCNNNNTIRSGRKAEWEEESEGAQEGFCCNGGVKEEKVASFARIGLTRPIPGLTRGTNLNHSYSYLFLLELFKIGCGLKKIFYNKKVRPILFLFDSDYFDFYLFQTKANLNGSFMIIRPNW